MFSKDPKASITPTTPTTPATPTGTNGANGDSAKLTGVPSIISPDLKIIGDLKSNGDIQIDGRIEGDINSRLLTVGEQATVEGCIVADTVRISGTVLGQVRAKTVHLDKKARVTGDITHEILTMEAGAFFEGQVRRMEQTSGASSAKVAPLHPVGSTNGQDPSFAGAKSADAQSTAP
ncbi:MAG: polymer-forming cytoskeletal protein [Proteobacteria bacterium]|nr:polymer-forming cytoskeletal protein [Pseudomonadota bacterium]